MASYFFYPNTLGPVLYWSSFFVVFRSPCREILRQFLDQPMTASSWILSDYLYVCLAQSAVSISYKYHVNCNSCTLIWQLWKLDFRFVHFYPCLLLIPRRSKAAFPLLVRLTNICYLCILATSWELCTCVDTGHLSLSVNVTQVKEITAGYVLTKSRLVAFPRRDCTWQADRWHVWIVAYPG
jgi:hypothetical protein